MRGYRNKIIAVLFITLLLPLLISCASTTATVDTWRDENYTGAIKKIFVIGASEKPGIRKIFEREFVNQLKAGGVDAMASYEHISHENMLDKDEIAPRISGLEVDSLLVTRVIAKTRVGRLIPGYYRNWSQYYNASSGCRQGYVCVEEVSLETNLYDVKTEKLIWSMMSETFIDEGNYSAIKSVIKNIIRNLHEETLLNQEN